MRDLQKLSVWALGGMLLLALASVGRGGLPAGTSAATYTAASSANVSEVPLGPSGFATYRITFTDMRPGDVAFEVLSTSEPSSFFVIADLTNNSSQDWAGLRMMLGTGSLDPGTATDHFEPFDPGGPDLRGVRSTLRAFQALTWGSTKPPGRKPPLVPTEVNRSASISTSPTA
jgi:hypothetical protein